MGNVCMAVLGGMAGAGLTLATGDNEGRGLARVATAYVLGGIGTMALFVMARCVQDDI